jgi:hypothetical protein
MQTLLLFVLMTVGAILCAVLGRAVTLRYRLPWREALLYFGLAAEPDET